MLGARYFDFLQLPFFNYELLQETDEQLFEKYKKMHGVYNTLYEISHARLRFEEGDYYVAPRMGREVLENIIIPQYEMKHNITESDYRIKYKGNISLFNKIDYLYDKKKLTKQLKNAYHQIRKLGNEALHNNKKITKEKCEEALKNIDYVLRYFIKSFIDQSYTKVNKKVTGHLGLSYHKTLQTNKGLIELSDNDSLKSASKKIKQDMIIVESMLKNATKMVTESSKTTLEYIHKVRAELTYMLASINRKILKECDWIYKILNKEESVSSREQIRAINSNNKTYKINGAAGTGKSLVLLAKCLRNLTEEKDLEKGIFITFNKSFMGYIQNILSSLKSYNDTEENLKQAIDRLEIINFDKYFNDLSQEDETFIYKNEVGYGQKIKAIIDHFMDKNISSYDIVAIDEAQDFSIDRIKLCYKLKNKHKNSRFYIAYDENQDIYRNGFSAKLIDKTVNFQGNSITLKKNMRNHINIELFSNEILKGNIQKIKDIEMNDQIKIMSKVEFNESLQKHIGSTAILCLSNEAKKRLLKELEENIHLEEIDETNGAKDGLYIGTVHSAKGLEYDRIYIYEFPTNKNETNLRYVTCTRARYEVIFVK